jgi:putative membrane protein
VPACGIADATNRTSRTDYDKELIAMLTFTVLAQRAGASDGWGHMDGWGGGWMWLWGTLMMFSWVAIIAAAIWFLSRSRDTTGSRPSRAKEILEERYASGELSTEEYRERLEHLR